MNIILKFELGLENYRKYIYEPAIKHSNDNSNDHYLLENKSIKS